MAASAAQLVLASGGSQDDIIKSGGQARVVAEDLLRAAKGTSELQKKFKRWRAGGRKRRRAGSREGGLGSREGGRVL